jgi:riboflavin biosynthesis pyrimidine reductase
MSEVPVRRLLPTPGQEALDELYLDLTFPPPPSNRPHVYLDMVASADGAATLAGRTADLGGDADRVAFSRRRGWADAILVGAGTVRVEDYGPPRPSAATRERRAANGMAPAPRLVVVTASGRLDPDARLFADPERPPLILARAAPPRERLAALDGRAEVRAVGELRVDLPDALAALRDDGVERVCCEGGPTLNAELLAAGLIDELFLTIAAQLVPRSPLRIIAGAAEPADLELVELREHAGDLLLRYRVGA